MFAIKFYSFRLCCLKDYVRYICILFLKSRKSTSEEHNFYWEIKFTIQADYIGCLKTSKAGTGGVLKKMVLKNFAKFTGKHLCESLRLQPATLFKKRHWHTYFPMNFAKNTIFIEHLRATASGFVDFRHYRVKRIEGTL